MTIKGEMQDKVWEEVSFTTLDGGQAFKQKALKSEEGFSWPKACPVLYPPPQPDKPV